MKVYDTNLTGAVGAGEAGRSQEISGAGRYQAGKSGASAAGTDRVEFSNNLNVLSRALSADSSGRAAIVERLTGLYQSGLYRPDAAGTSRAMVTEALNSGLQ